MRVETVRLSRIVLKLTPEMYPFLRSDELEAEIVLRDGFESLEPDDAVEIVTISITEYQKDALIQ
jgi:hypothetical protein